jgi:RimJ/RimL family protein N-acetyltransferase
MAAPHEPLAELFRGRRVRLSAPEPERDAASRARWSLDSEFLRLLDSDPAQPRTARFYEANITRNLERENSFLFHIRALAGDRLLGFINLRVLSWTSAQGRVGIGIGERADWGRGYGTEAMQLVLRFAFAELNLARVSLEALAGNARALRSYEKAGFRLEGVQREWEHRDGRRNDVVVMGILREDYQHGQISRA